MLSIGQLGERVGMSTAPVSLTAAAEVFGISVPFSYKQVSAAVESGNVPRPFYIIGHNTNTIADVKSALASGANAVEADVNVFGNHPDQLCISHGEGGDDALPLDLFLSQLHPIV